MNMQQMNTNNRERELIPFILLTSITLITFLFWKATLKGVPTEPAAPAQAEIVGTKAPDFTLPDLNGIKQTLSDYRGKLVFLNIWATWCKPCRDEMPAMQKLYTELEGLPFEMIAVSIDEDGEKSVKPFVKEFGLTFPVFLDPQGTTARLYETTGVPETFLIDKSGTVIHKVVGPSDWSRTDWVHVFKNLLQQGGETAGTGTGS